MAFNNIDFRRKSPFKFLGVIIDKYLTLKYHINIGVFYGASHLLVFKNLLKSTSPSFTFISIALILNGLVLLKLSSTNS